MATGELERPRTIVREAAPATHDVSAGSVAKRVLSVFASLRVTVTLFALAIFLIFVGTLAQKDQDVWQVVNDTYFRVWFARIDFVTFERLVQLFAKGVEWNLSGGFYFFGGKSIGLALIVNLLAAHAVRFKVAAAGRRLAVGTAAIVAGLVITYAAIQSGMNDAVESELSPAFCDLLWQIFRGSLALLALAGAYVLVFFGRRLRWTEWTVLVVGNVLIAALAVWLLANPEARLDNSGIRILWQLVKGSAAGVVLLVGCVMVFRKRAGIVLLHGGIALMMLSELLTGISAEESRMAIAEGQTVNFSDDIRTSELAIIDRSPADHDQVTVVPAPLLAANVGGGEPIAHPDLPFKIQVHRWMQNSQLRAPAAGESNPATAGFGTRQIAEPVRAATGVGEDAQKVDFPAAYIELFSKESGDSLGTYLASQWLHAQPVEVDGKTYDVALRFKRIYHPFSLTLKEFRFDRYTGTNTAKNFSSLVEFKDPQHNIDREVLIWMNNPLRYAGTTFYQSSFDEATERGTVLQVVRNPSWMTPYVACMLVATGMLAHFGTMLVRFLRRRADEAQLEQSRAVSPSGRDLPKGRRKARAVAGAQSTAGWSLFAKWFPALVVIVFAGYIAGKARMPKAEPSEMQVYAFGKLPLAYQGRIKPYDTLARNSLQILSGRQEVGVIDSQGDVVKKLPAIHWLLDAISGAEAAGDHRVFRVENLDLLDTLDLEQRPLFWRYSLNEILSKQGELDRQIELAGTTAEEERSLFQNKVLELARKRNMYTALVLSFRSPPLSADREQFADSLKRTQFIISELKAAQAPHAVPPQEANTQWTMLVQAELEALQDRITNQTVNPATISLSSMLAAYARGDVATFNRQLAEYRTHLGTYEQTLEENQAALDSAGAANAEVLSQSKVDFEVFFNQFSPFYYAAVLYLVAFVLGVLSWVIWTEPMRQASMWLLWMTFALHTFALIARIYISGRPPVTNLYSTAIFIGWGGVLMALVFESIQRIGLGNIVAAVMGFLTLLVAYNLSLDGDTFLVLQAVLDTQFWLATHVVTINLGYSATYVAGVWGALYLLTAHVFPLLSDDARHKLLRTLYGTLCFAIFFSFIGTVLGGLWADDSWGRFWGWDPKENGALMIVLWNALVLHARWGGLVKGRGLATLAVGGNIITTWSYFGVNELGVGLHSYGAFDSTGAMAFFKNPTAMWIFIFASSQLALIGLGMMPSRWFDVMRLAGSSATK
jgi:ABC-type transport system involved in cytochrome c biogenesis permease subunit